MLKFKPIDNTENELDFIEISTTKSTDKVVKEQLDASNNLVNAFIELFSQPEGLKSLKSFLITTSLWDLLLFPSDEEFPLVKSTIIHLYFSIPDRVSAAFKFETDEFFFPRNFWCFTEDSLTQSFRTSSNLKRFIFALECIEAFALNKLVKIPLFWDSLDFEVISQLSNTAKQNFLASLHKNILSLNLSFRKLDKIIKKISLNLKFEVDNLVNLFLEQFISKGTLDHKELAISMSSYAVSFKDSNEFITNLFSGVLKIWSNDSWTFRTPFNSQLHYSSCLMIISSLISPDLFVISALMEETLMNGVQTRFDHSDPQIRLIGTCVAEILNQMHPESENKLDFALDSKNEIVFHLRGCQKLTRSILYKYSDIKDNIISDVVHNADDTTVSSDDHSSSTALSSDDDGDDLKPISCLLVENEAKNSKTPLPRFLPDCLKLLRKNEEAQLVEKVLHKLEDTFTTSPRLSRQLHSVSAFNTLLTLNDHFEIENFDNLRHKSMEILLIDQIKIVGPELIDSIFKSNKLVLGQKMELLLIMSSSMQHVFRPNAKHVTSDAFNNLNQFEKTFLISETSEKTQKSNLLINDFLEHLCLPLLTQSIRHFQHFKRNHVMFLEKFLWLQAIVLNFSKNYLPFDNLVEKYLDFIHLTLTTSTNSSTTTISGASTNLIEQIPIQKAILIGTSVVLTSWPAKLPVIQYYQRLQEIYAFLDEVANGPGFKEDAQLQALGTSVALALQELTDPQKLLQESAEQMTLDLKTVKITNLSQ